MTEKKNDLSRKNCLKKLIFTPKPNSRGQLKHRSGRKKKKKHLSKTERDIIIV